MTTPPGHTPPPAAAAPGPAAKPPGIGFDFDNGNFIRDLVTTNAGGAFPPESGIGPNDSTIYIWITHLFQLSWFDAMAPYHPTAVGVYSRIDRRPAEEAATNRNKNIAGLYASYQVVRVVFEERAQVMRQGMLAVGLDPDDQSLDPTTAIGIGNIAGKAVVEARLRDGMNFLGDEGRSHHPRPFADYTGHRPTNTPDDLNDPSRWQPTTGPHRRRVGGGPGDMGIFVTQRFATPHFERVKAHTFQDPTQFKLAPLDELDHTDTAAHRRAVDEVLQASAALSDEQKVKAEFFDNELMGVTLAPRAAAEAHGLDLDGWCHLFTVTSVARFDGLIAAWHHKRAHEAPRPAGAVRHLLGDTPVTAWGGPGKGTVDGIPADQWESYLPAGDHPGYPSGVTTLCASQAQAARRFLGDDVLNWKSTLPAGSTRTEPGTTPAQDTELTWDTWSDFENDSAAARVWAGVHFRATAERSIEFGAQFGDLAHEFIQRHINGDVQD
ncbi:DUF6851 domain-containing protein [Streptomyces fructofermentans]|uniref:Vanadium-dependent haloperoxidase n=1 Tax=Streptomyces fructofermentans TaxID=152141 RepID=A0A918NTN4_9ACTN|nr:hypothetical protein [Streptomyces fructofermentans]GGX93633.1 hypothetical protein GCM10010515_70680 [Streptomyces fructofermentans]